MAFLKFVEGAQIVLGGQPHRLVVQVQLDTGPSWLLRNVANGLAVTKTVEELKAAYESGDLVRHYDEPVGTEAQKKAEKAKRVVCGDGLPPRDRDRRQQRAKFLRLVEGHLGEVKYGIGVVPREGAATSLLHRALAAAAKDMPEGFRRPSPATYYRWKLKAPDLDDPRGLEGDFCLRGNHRQLHPVTKDLMLKAISELLAKASDKRGVGTIVVADMSVVERDIKARIASTLEASPELEGKLVCPSMATLHRYWNQFPAFERAVARHGRSRATNLFRMVRGHDRPTYPYELVEYDETPADLWFIDEVHGVPLGRGTLCAAMDVATHSLGGFHLSFEPCSDLTMMSTLRHAVSLKSYVAADYGDAIRNSWKLGGMPHAVALDNSRQAWGNTLKTVCGILDLHPRWLPRRTPWFKPYIEGFFHVLRKTLLEHMPGFVPGRDLDAVDYVPGESACIGVRQFVAIFTKWVLDVFHQKPLESLDWRTPDQAYDQMVSIGHNGGPQLLDSQDEVETLFGVVRTGTLDHRGLRFEGLYYSCDAAWQLLLQKGLLHRGGASMPVQFKFNPVNLGRVQVLEPVHRAWIPVTALRADYADGLSLYVHRLVRKHNRNRGRREDEEAYLVGLAELHAMIREVLPLNLSPAVNAAAARVLGVGTHVTFGVLDRLGNRFPGVGPWEGHSITSSEPPAATLSATSEPKPSAPQAALSDPETRSGPAGGASGLHSAPARPSDAEPRRRKPLLDTDTCL